MLVIFMLVGIFTPAHPFNRLGQRQYVFWLFSCIHTCVHVFVSAEAEAFCNWLAVDICFDAVLFILVFVSVFTYICCS